MAKELFRMEGISKSFPGVKALDNVSFSVNVGEVHGLVGENGAGKSTLMKIMSGVYQEDEGKIFIDNEQVKIDTVKKAQELGVSIIFQELNLCPHLTVADNIFIGRPPKRGLFIDDKKMHREAKEILDGLGININTRAVTRTLSVAQQQMVEIAKAISYNSKILVLDEPTAALTEKEIDQLFEIIKTLQEKGVGMVYISHRMEELERICERVTIIRDGQYIGTHNYCDLTVDELVNMIVGRELDDKFPKYDRTIGEVFFEAKNIKTKDNIELDHLEVRKGEIVGISGLMGSGRSEIVRAIFGADPVISKEIYMHGEQIKINKVSDAIKHGIGYATEDRKFDGLALGLDVKYNINMAHLPNITKFGIVDDKLGKENAEHYTKALRIKTPGIQQLVGNLSGGNQQKIVLSKWLCNNVDLLIVDEPTRGIDVGAKYEVYELFNELSDQGVGIIMISSELPEILGMSDRVLVIHEGRLNGELDAKTATQEEILFLAAGYNKTKKSSLIKEDAEVHISTLD
ncbi:sugar ABC transporter ATP-binding protein [Erysipelothrix sp. HDW6C]|uniref:sugar ABC transporter ATP-binding protein n=1 Tax=Erysipelothrix sp. HDW6C TaxID=2714930 RepID=UPI0014097DEB|nr:sugar ABC transporter ATP-binding protein [Erysipelothrix sp. HDW6C]QIK69293.1 sugar ABC transporter ATP-binding protein [Erysipelothrix sp. HDW6C]